MTGSSRAALAIIVLVLLCGGTYYLVRNNEGKAGPAEPALKTYSSAAYGFSFAYDPAYSLADFPSDRYVNIEKPGDEPNEVVSVAVEIAEQDGEFTDFEDYVHQRSLVFCAADGPYESLRCTKVTRSEPFVSATGVRGDVFYLEMEHTRGDDTSYREVGPFYAFDLSQSGSAPYTALIIRPARFYEESEMYDEGAKAANDIVNTLVITR